ncbi:MAG: proprotein convertase P-domain-containing protein [Gemmataceae bacterium]|nr:proprotein convertase P-domain-containing protein [Gemmataceae bacterium]
MSHPDRRRARLSLESLESRLAPAASLAAPLSQGIVAVQYAQVAAVSAPQVVNAVPQGGPSSLSGFRLSFDRAMNASTFTVADVALVGPDGKAVAIASVKPAAGYSGNVFDVGFAAQTKAGSYALKVGPDVKDGAGVQMSVYQKAFAVAAPAAPPRLVNAVAQGSTTSLSGFRLSFDKAMNASTFTTADVALTSPDGKAVAIASVKAVAGYSGNVFDVAFAAQTKAGSYALQVGPAVKDAAGTDMVLFQKSFSVAAPAAALRIVNASALGSATSLAGVRLSFDRAVNAASFTAADLSLVGPDGKAVAIVGVKMAAGYSGGTVWDVSFAAQAKAGSYSFKAGPAIADAAGVQMASAFAKAFTLAQGTAPASAPSTVSPGATAYWSNSTANITPNGKAVAMIAVNKSALVGNVKVEMNITHARVSDLYVYLQAPDGTIVPLVNRAGGTAANYTDTSFDDSASAPVGNPSQGPITGTYKPVSPLSALVGRTMSGTWKLWVEDKAGVRSGTLTGWSMLLTPKG